jgi:hypothetical protein
VQWYNAVTTAQKMLRDGGDDALALREAKNTGRLAGRCVITWSNCWMVLAWHRCSRWIPRRSFTDHTGLVHCTSLYTQPLFVQGVNYNGKPHFSRSALLRERQLMKDSPRKRRR